MNETIIQQNDQNQISMWLDPFIAQLIKNISWPSKSQYKKRDNAIKFLRWESTKPEEDLSIQYFDALVACNMPSAAWDLVKKLAEYKRLNEHAMSIINKLKWLWKIWSVWELIEINSY